MSLTGSRALFGKVGALSRFPSTGFAPGHFRTRIEASPTVWPPPHPLRVDEAFALRGCDEAEDVSPPLCDNGDEISFKRVVEAVMRFAHPLAKQAKVWPMKTRDGSDRNVLVVVTSLVLDPQSEKYKKKLVDRLSEAAAAYVAGNAGITDFVLINRIKEWE